MAATCLLSASATFDAIAYARAMVEDNSSPFTFPDATMLLLVEKAVEEYSRHLPLDETIGNPSLATSPFNTIANQIGYVCNPTNGFVVPPLYITDVLYRAGAAYSAANELAYLAIMPFSPVNRFLYSPNLLDSPSERILRNEYLNELQHYGKGFAGLYRDRATGLWVIDLYPIPTGSSIPVFVRYQAQHPNTGTALNLTFPTIPEDLKYPFGDLLYANCLDIEADRISKNQLTRAGLLQIQGSAADTRLLAEKVRFEALATLGAFQGVAQVTS